mmetsp:Transcript_32185/g.78457  ORF Transcript_32185/g.78457 Transcript_32185/m.78457 type:complete len:231 (+) Transcript_32185:115-807(+)
MVLVILLMTLLVTLTPYRYSTNGTDSLINVDAFQPLHYRRTLPSSSASSSSCQRSTLPNRRRICKSTAVYATKDDDKNNDDDNCDDKSTDDDELLQVPSTMEMLERNQEEKGEETKSVSSLNLKTIISKIVNLVLDIWGAGIMVLGLAFTFGLVLNIMGYGYRFSTTEFLHIDTLDNIRTERQFEIIERRYERERIQKMKMETKETETTETAMPLMMKSTPTTSSPSTSP